MKNMKIGKKITLAFGIVIVIMAILAITVVSTNILTISNVNNIASNSDLQTAVNDTLDSFNAARIQANIIYNVISEEADKAFIENADLTEQNFTRIYTYIDGDSALETYRADVQNAHNDFTAWRAAVQEVIDDNTRLGEIREDLTALGADLAANANVAINSQIEELGNEVTSGADSAALLRRNNRITEASEITNTMTNFRLAMRTMLQTFDASDIDNILADMDKTISQAETFSLETNRADTKASIIKLIDIVKEYRSATVEFADLCNLAPGKISTARSVGDSSTDFFLTVVGNVDSGMANAVEETASLALFSLIIVAVMVMIALTVSVIMAKKLINAIVPPIVLIKDVAVQVGQSGDLNFTDEFRDNFMALGNTNDETGETIRNFGGLIDRLRVIGSDLETIASKDLSIDIDLLGEKDVMGNALNSMVVSLNEMFEEINRVATEVSSSSGEIANGAQLLAQGSTEQASTIEEVSASIEQINLQMDKNTNTSNAAAEHGEQINNIASEGGEKLQEMMDAVKSISESASEIEGVIKVIEDIAFQTNILALNAAVEAARAGEHGKGFAVVADEVRNLASKSGDAAKETAALISTSIEKSEMGMEISGQTAKSFEKIIEGIQETSKSLKIIAQDSASSKASTEQVSMAIEQVAQVVQQNSATSQQSAASSEELSSMASVLQSLIGEFKLKSTANNISL